MSIALPLVVGHRYEAPGEPYKLMVTLIRSRAKSLGTRGRRKSMNDATHHNGLLDRLAATQDKQAFAELFEYFAPRLKSVLLRSGTDYQTAEELAQEAMLSVWRKSHLFDPAKASASTWVFTIARNLRIDRFRRERRPELDPNDPSLVPEAESPVDDQLHAQDRGKRIRECLDELPLEQQEVVRLSFNEGLTHQEIADRLELPLGTVKSRIRLSFAKLRPMLRNEI